MPLMKNQLLEAGEGPALCSHSALYLTFLAQGALCYNHQFLWQSFPRDHEPLKDK